MKRFVPVIILLITIASSCHKEANNKKGAPITTPSIFFPHSDSVAGNFHRHYDDDIDYNGGFAGNHISGGSANMSSVTYFSPDSVLLNMSGVEGFSWSWSGKLNSAGNFSSTTYGETIEVKITSDTIIYAYYYAYTSFQGGGYFSNRDTITFNGKIVHK